MLIAFLLLMLIPLIGVSAFTIWQQYENSQAQIRNQLTSVATLKEAEVKSWFNSLSPDLELVVADPRVRSDITELIARQRAEIAPTAQRGVLLDTLAVALTAGKNFDEMFLMDAAGTVVLSTNRIREGQTFDTQPFFQQGLNARYVQTPFYSLLYDKMVVFAAAPVRDEKGVTQGVLAGVASLDALNVIMRERAGLGQTGETYLVNSDSVMLTEPRYASPGGFPAVHTQGANAALAGLNGFDLYGNYQYPATPVVGVYRWIPELQVALLAEQSQAEAFATTFQNIWTMLGITIVVAIATTGAAIVVARGIATPLEQLTSIATHMAGGDLTQTAQIERGDEIGLLASVFNEMTAQLRGMIGGLEGHIAARTAELEAQTQALRESEQRLARRAREMAALYETALEINSQPDVPLLLQAVVRRAAELLGVRMGALYLMRPDGETLELVVNHNLPGDYLGVTLRLGEGLSGRIAQTGCSLMVDDYGHWPERAVPYAGARVQRVLGVPLKIGERVIGVLNVTDDARAGPFDEEEIRLASLFADQAAIAVENARLYQAEREQHALAETLREVGVTLASTLDVDTVLNRILEQVSRVVPNDTATIMLVEGDHTHIVRQSGYNRVGAQELATAFTLRVANTPTLRSMAESGEPLVISDTRADPRWTFLPETEWIRSYAGVPIRARGEVIGFLNVDSLTPGLYGPAHTLRLRVFAVQAALSIENARLYTAVQQELAERKRIEAALRESEERYRALVETSPDAITLADLNGNLVMANRRTVELYRFASAEEMIGASGFDLIAPEDRPRLIENVQKTLESGSSRDIEYTLLRKDGSRFPGEVSGSVIVDAEGKPAMLVAVTRDMTERKQLESALQDSEQRYREIFEASPDAIFLLEVLEDGQHFRNIDVNPAFEKMTGTVRADLIGKTMEETSSVEVAQVVNAKYRRCVAARTTCEEEAELNLPMGCLIFHSTLVPLQDAEGHVRRIIGITRDITERKRMEESLRESEEKHRILFMNSPDAYLILINGIFVDCNQATEVMLRGDRTRIIGRPPDVLSPEFQPDGRKSVEAAEEKIKDALRTGNTTFEWVHRRLDGSDFFVEVSIASMMLGGKPALFAIWRDITERKRAEEALAASEALYRSILRASPDDITITDMDGCIRMVSPVAIQMFGYEREEEILGRPLIDFMAREDIDRALSNIALMFQGVMTGPAEYRVLRMDGSTFDIEANGDFIRHAEGPPTQMIFVIRDITERKRAEEELRRAKETAEAADRAKSIFLTNMSHELRTPLNAILGFSDLMARDSSLSAEQQENLTIINRSGEHLLSLINNVLDMAKIESGRMVLQAHVFNLHHLLDNLADLFRLRAVDKGLTLIVERALEVPRYIRADEDKLRQVLINLLGNAVKFTGEGGVGLRVQCAGSEKPGFCQLRFEVQDTGPGIAPEDLEPIFEPFVQSAGGYKSTEGTGLGLPISRQFARLMDGELAAENSGVSGQGALFKLDIPVELAVATDLPSLQKPERPRVIGLEPGQRAADGGAVSGGPYRLLVVEDREEGRKLLVKLLTQFGFEVRAAANGLEGVNVWREWQPHLIWMDMRMPIMDGHEATQLIKATPQGQATVIIALTATAFEDQRELVLSEGCDDFVRKPFRESDIVDALVKHLGVRFIYESGRVTPPLGAPPQGTLDLAGLPAGWMADLKQAAIEANAGRVVALAEQIREQKPALAAALIDRINNFDLDAILGAIRTLEPQEAKDE